MPLSPAILALLLAATVGLGLFTAAAGFGWQVVRRWDIRSGSELQLRLERQTYLVSTILAFVFATQLVALLLMVFNADRMAVQFVGAMCAVGTLNASPFGWPVMGLKILIFFLASTWLILNHVDTRGYDYPLTRLKYRLLLVILPIMALEAYLQLRYFLGLDPDVITSCCGSLFGADRETFAAELSGLPPAPAMGAFYGVLVLTIGVGVLALRQPRLSYLFGALSAAAFVVTIVAVLSFISLYVYEHPHHHCPFCLLKAEYHYLGYGLYLPLFAATALGLGVGAVHPFRQVASLRNVVPAVTRRLTLAATIGFGLVLLWSTYMVARSNLILLGG